MLKFTTQNRASVCPKTRTGSFNTWGITFCTLFLLIFAFSVRTFAQGFATVDFHQAQNDRGGAGSYQIDWVNGSLNSTHTDYFEGIGVPQRIIFTGLQPNNANANHNKHSLRFQIYAQKSGKHAYDYPISWQQALLTAGDIGNGSLNELQNLFPQQCGTAFSSQAQALCGALSSGANVQTPAFPDAIGNPGGGATGVNTSISCFEQTYGNRTLEIRGSQPVTSASLQFIGYIGGDMAEYLLVWESTSPAVLIRFAAHLSVGAGPCGYGAGQGAGSINGAPYHVKLIRLDDVDNKSGVSLGSQDNQIMSGAIQIPPNCAITGVDNACAGSGNVTFSTTSLSGETYAWSIINISGANPTPTSGTGASFVVNVGNSAGTFTVRLTVTSAGGTRTCDKTFTVNNPATANAGGPYTMCTSDGSVQVTGTYGGGATGGTWSGGSGSFSNETTNTQNKTVTATYTPAAGETSVTLTFTTDDPAGPCNSVSANATLTISPAATANAGGPYTMCTSDGSVQVSGTFGGGATSGSWSAPAGTGSFSNETTNGNTVTAVFTPVAGQTSVTLTFTTNDPAGPCNSASATANLTISPAATANAGGPYTICASDGSVQVTGTYGGGATGGTWSGGSGSFSNETTNTQNKTVTATYTPAAGETSVTLTFTTDDPTGPCNSVSANATLNITANPTGPVVEYIPPKCDETTFSVKVKGAVDGGTYTLTQDAGGVGPIVKTTAADKDADGNILFDNLTVGKGFSITVKVGNCTSAATDCSNFETQLNRLVNSQQATSVTNIQPVNTVNANIASSKTKVSAAPNPFNSNIKFTLQSDVSGQGSLEIYNMQGQKVKTLYQGHIQKGYVQYVDYNVPVSQRTNLIYVFSVGDQRVTGKLIGLK